ncbi:hypothetical protein AB0I60_01310 [Actinosynnema sp. NPDC050436]|uniref:SRPBCC family protein n=1 Tax=Actinosynnema sp. NPDC050436 TaxID=3155659 RepID=UPI0033F9BFDE
MTPDRHGPDGLILAERHPPAAALERARAARLRRREDDLFCTRQVVISALPHEVFAYLREPEHLAEWTYSLRGLARAAGPDLWRATDLLTPGSEVFLQLVAHEPALAVDLRAGAADYLWITSSLLVRPAGELLAKPGSVVFWSTARHPNYDSFPLAPTPDDVWASVAGFHDLELHNLKSILESGAGARRA